MHTMHQLLLLQEQLIVLIYRLLQVWSAQYTDMLL
jgi:hypothetical protein